MKLKKWWKRVVKKLYIGNAQISMTKSILEEPVLNSEVKCNESASLLKR